MYYLHIKNMKIDRKNNEKTPMLLVGLLESPLALEQTKLLLVSLTMGFCACSSGALQRVSFGRLATFCPL
ncbi:hypothetical protein X975_09384, partial [Stegodyphus mimosarum]